MDGGITIIIDTADIGHLVSRLGSLADPELSELMTMIGALGESQTRRRIEEEKTAPDGSAWPPNKEGTSILRRTGRHLLDSIAFEAGSNEVQWGSSWEFAHVHQYGATIVPKSADALAFQIGGRWVHAQRAVIPARPFVGLSSENAKEIEELATDWFGGLLQ